MLTTQFPLTRLRRMRQSPNHRQLLRETALQPSDLICPFFIIEGENKRQAIKSMPGVERLSLDQLVLEVQSLVTLGVQMVALFPVLELALRTPRGEAAYEPDNLMARAICLLKREVPTITIIADVALDPYTSHGHDGVLNAVDYVDNDETNICLVRQALSLAHAGADILAPSDMMDGRVGLIRQALETEHFPNTCILAYSAKYASKYYGPFRDALNNQDLLGRGTKATYQMDPANRLEALRETAQDIAEGADMVMVKPAMPYLDVLREIKQRYQMPTLAYQVSGEYCLHQAAIAAGYFEAKDLILESLVCIKRAGADAILSYFTPAAARWLS